MWAKGTYCPFAGNIWINGHLQLGFAFSVQVALGKSGTHWQNPPTLLGPRSPLLRLPNDSFLKGNK